MRKLKVKDFCRKNIAVESDIAEVLYYNIEYLLSKDIEVILDFEDIKEILNDFLKRSIGNLYFKYNKNHIKKYLKIINLNSEEEKKLKLIISDIIIDNNILKD